MIELGDITDDEFKKLLDKNLGNNKPDGKEDKKDGKAAKGIRDNITLDPKIYELFDYYKKELGYDGDFGQFLVDMTLGNAKKNGIDIQVVKSASKGNFIQGIPNGTDGKENGKSSDDNEYDVAMQLLGVNTGNPKQMAFQQLLEERKLQLEERRLKMDDMRLSMEAKQLDLERKKIENDKLRKEISVPIAAPKFTEDGTPITPMSASKDREFELYKMMNDNNMKFMEMLSKTKESGQDNNQFVKFLMEQNRDINNTIMALQNNYSNEKFKELESIVYSNTPEQQLEKMAKQFEMFSKFTGTGPKPIEQIKLEADLEMKKLELEREKAKEERDEARASNITEAIKDTIGNFTKSIGEPMGNVLAEQAKQRLAEAQKKASEPKKDNNNDNGNASAQASQQPPPNGDEGGNANEPIVDGNGGSNLPIV